MRKTWLAAALLVASATLGGMTVVVHAQGVGPNDIGHYRPLSGSFSGVLDSWTGVLYYVDPVDSKHVIVMDMIHAQYGVRSLSEQKVPSWTAPPASQGSSLPDSRGVQFQQVENRLEVMDTRSGDSFSLEGNMQGKASDWKDGAVSVVLTRLIGAGDLVKAKQPLKKG